MKITKGTYAWQTQTSQQNNQDILIPSTLHCDNCDTDFLALKILVTEDNESDVMTIFLKEHYSIYILITAWPK